MRGQDEFVRVSWDEALNLIHTQHKRIRDSYGPSSILPVRTVGVRTVCYTRPRPCCSGIWRWRVVIPAIWGLLNGAAQAIMPYVVGGNEVYQQQTSWPVVLEHSDVVVLWSANPLNTLKIAGTPLMSRGSRTLRRYATAVNA